MFKVGDRVRYSYAGGTDLSFPEGLVGEVLDINGDLISVRFPGFQYGHSIHGFLPSNSTEGWHTYVANLTLVGPRVLPTWPPKSSRGSRYKEMADDYI